DELRAGADAIEQKPDPPDQLEAVAALPPLVQHHRSKGEAQHRRPKRQHDVEHVHEKDSTIATLTSFRNQPTFVSRSARPTLAAPSSVTLDRTIPSKRWNARIASPRESPAPRASSAYCAPSSWISELQSRSPSLRNEMSIWTSCMPSSRCWVLASSSKLAYQDSDASRPPLVAMRAWPTVACISRDRSGLACAPSSVTSD